MTIVRSIIAVIFFACAAFTGFAYFVLLPVDAPEPEWCSMVTITRGETPLLSLPYKQCSDDPFPTFSYATDQEYLQIDLIPKDHIVVVGVTVPASAGSGQSHADAAGSPPAE